MKKVVAVIATLSLFAGCFAGCTPVEQPEDARTTLSRKASYAGAMQFTSVVGSGVILSSNIYYERYSDLALVMSEAESAGFSDDVLVAWPSELTEGILLRLNERVSDDRMDLEPYNLTYPVTMTNVVENWQDVNNLLGNIKDVVFILDPDFYTLPQSTQ
jgi:hypothetical protein